MEITDKQLNKIADEHTRVTLEAAHRDTPLRVLLTVAEQALNEESQAERPDPAEATSRTEMRKQLLEKRKLSRSGSFTEIVDQLSNQNLDIKGKDQTLLTRTIVVDGTANDILNGLELPGIERIQLDQVLSSE